MFEALGLRANKALLAICDENVPRPLKADDAGYLHFFTQVVARLEGGAGRARQLITEKSRDTLGRVFSRVFSHLLSLDPDFDLTLR